MAADRLLAPLGDLESIPERDLLIYRPYLDSETLRLFARVSRTAKQEVDSIGLYLFHAMQHAVKAVPNSYSQEDPTRLRVMVILEHNPALLFAKAKANITITDHFDREIETSSLYRLLLGAGDTWALKQIHERIIPQIEGGEALAEAQFRAQHPNCLGPFTPEMGEEVLYDDRNRAMVAAVAEKLIDVVAKITADPCTNGQATLDATTKVIEGLCEIFKPKPGEIIRTGLHFPLAIVREIFRTYDAQLDWTIRQLSYFSRTVIGAAEAALTAVDGQCCKMGLSALNCENGPDRRDGLICPRPCGVPVELAPLVGKLGRTAFVDTYDGVSCFSSSTRVGRFDCYNKKAALGGRGVAIVMRGAGLRVGKLMENKSRDIWKILCGHSQTSQHTIAMTMTSQRVA